MQNYIGDSDIYIWFWCFHLLGVFKFLCPSVAKFTLINAIWIAKLNACFLTSFISLYYILEVLRQNLPVERF